MKCSHHGTCPARVGGDERGEEEAIYHVAQINPAARRSGLPATINNTQH